MRAILVHAAGAAAAPRAVSRAERPQRLQAGAILPGGVAAALAAKHGDRAVTARIGVFAHGDRAAAGAAGAVRKSAMRPVDLVHVVRLLPAAWTPPRCQDCSAGLDRAADDGAGGPRAGDTGPITAPTCRASRGNVSSPDHALRRRSRQRVAAELERLHDQSDRADRQQDQQRREAAPAKRLASAFAWLAASRLPSCVFLLLLGGPLLRQRVALDRIRLGCVLGFFHGLLQVSTRNARAAAEFNSQRHLPALDPSGKTLA